LKKLFAIPVIVILIVSLVLSGCSSEVSTPKETNAAPAVSTTAASPQNTTSEKTTAAQTFKLKLGTTQSANNPIDKFLKTWAEKIQQETNGQVQITIYSGGTLVSYGEVWNELLRHTADIGVVTAGDPGSPFPIEQSVQSFVYGADMKTLNKVWKELWNEFPEIRAESSAAMRLGGHGVVSAYIHTKTPIKTLADFKGLQLQPNPSFPALISELGATGTTLPFTEIYPSLDKGIISGAMMPLELLQTMNLVDVTRYSTNLHMAGTPSNVILMNMDTWNEFSPDIQKVFNDNEQWLEDGLTDVLLKMDQETIDFAKSKGHEFLELSADDQNQVYNIMDKLALAKAAELDAKGLPGTKVYQETRRLIKQYNTGTDTK
jgi:TRAP-type transport system periplasmic protein